MTPPRQRAVELPTSRRLRVGGDGGMEMAARTESEQPLRRNTVRSCRLRGAANMGGVVQRRRNPLRDVRLRSLVGRLSPPGQDNPLEAASDARGRGSESPTTDTAQGPERVLPLPHAPQHGQRGARRHCHHVTRTNPQRSEARANRRIHNQEPPCAAPHCSPARKPSSSQPQSPCSATGGEPHISCPVCLDSLGTILKSSRALCSTVCGHVYCSDCIRTVMKLQRRCPVCQNRLTIRKYHKLSL